MFMVSRARCSGAQKTIFTLMKTVLVAMMSSCVVMGVAQAANRAPTISGTPPTTATVGKLYYFKPTAYDPDGQKLTFGIKNRPSWASLRADTGVLSGTPRATGKWSNIVVVVWDGYKTTALPAFSITVKAATTATGTVNSAPRISGTPPTSVKQGYVYSFTPTASDANGDKLGFSISNKPSWAAFSTTTGKLSGAAYTLGTFSNIVIRVSDGKTSVALPAFSITVVGSSGASTGAATLSWMPPTLNTDGSALTNLSGYRIYYGTNRSALDRTIRISNVSITRYVIDGLSPATYYFAVKAVNSAGVESSLSNVASKTIN